MKHAVITEQLSKTYVRSGLRLRKQNEEPTMAVADVSFTVEQGERFGLLGPNGAGKTTLAKMLCTLIVPSSGTAKVAGIDLEKDRVIRSVTGLVVSDERSFYWRLSTEKNLRFFAALHGLYGRQAEARIGRVLDDVGLSSRAKQRFSDLSSGMRQRLAIARALLHEPKVLFLDEPTRSLDPVATAHIHELLIRLQDEKQISIVLITHDLQEAEKMCQRVALMHKGKIQAIGRPEDLRHSLDPRQRYVIHIDSAPDSLGDELAKISTDFELSADIDGDGGVQLIFSAGEQDNILSAALELLQKQDLKIRTIDAAPPSLEEVFTRFTGESGDAGQ